MAILSTLSIIVPVFNEEKTVIPVIESLITIKLPQAIKKEIIVVNDGSTDSTLKKLKTLTSQKKFKSIHVYSLPTNQGKGAAVKKGITKATGEYVIIQDADMEYDPEYIKELVQPIISGTAEVVYGSRLDRLPHFTQEERRVRFFVHYVGNRFLSLVTSILYGQWLTDMETCYKLFPRKAALHMTLKARGFELEPELTAKLIKAGYKITELPIVTKPRTYEEGKKLNTVSDGIKAIKALILYRFSS